MGKSRSLFIGQSAQCSAIHAELEAIYDQVDVVDDLGAALQCLQKSDYESVFLLNDRLSPHEVEGVVLLRESRLGVPLFLIAETTARSIARSLEIGADDCVPGTASRDAIKRALHRASVRRWSMLRSIEGEGCGVLVFNAGSRSRELDAAVAALRAHNYTVTVETELKALLWRLRSDNFQVLLVDGSAPAKSASSAVSSGRRYDPRLEVLITNETGSLDAGIPVFHQGKVDLLFEPIRVESVLAGVAAARKRYLAADRQYATGRRLVPGVRVLLLQAIGYRVVREVLERDGAAKVRHTVDLDEALSLLKDDSYDVLVTDLSLPPSSKVGVFLQLRHTYPRLPIFVLADPGDEFLAQQLVASGAQDLVPKALVEQAWLVPRICYAVERERRLGRLERIAGNLQARDSGLREVIERSADGIIVVGSDSQVLFANPSAAALLGSAQRHWVGEPLGYVLPYDGTAEIEVHNPDTNDRLFVEVRVVPMLWDGQPARLATLRDTTARHQAETLRGQLAQTERLVAIGQLAAGVTHEINNPAAFVLANLTAMQWQLQSVRKFFDEAGPQRPGSNDRGLVQRALNELEDMLSENMEGMERIRSIVKDLRTFARIEQDEVEWVDLNDVIEVSCNFASNEIRHRARLLKKLTKLPQVPGARGKMAQVVTNLLVNAAQAIVEGDADNNSITVATWADENAVHLSIEDTGVGMSDEVLTRIFDPFFTTKSTDTGTGLGLSLCADIVRKHAGELAVSSRPGHGSRFEVRLPLQNGLVPPTALPELDSQSPSPLGRLRVLVVDDEPLVLRAYRRMLFQHEVVTALGGQKALEVIESDRNFDIVLCDLMMPDMDGPILFEEIQKTASELAPRLVFCSGGAFTQRTRGFISGVTNIVLEKPLTLQAFNAAARRLLALSQTAADLCSAGQ